MYVCVFVPYVKRKNKQSLHIHRQWCIAYEVDLVKSIGRSYWTNISKQQKKLYSEKSMWVCECRKKCACERVKQNCLRKCVWDKRFVYTNLGFGYANRDVKHLYTIY